MITTDELLRETFAVEATTITVPLGTRARVEQLRRRYRSRRAAMITGAAVAAVAVAVAVPVVVTSYDEPRVNQSVAAGSASYESWAPRGGLGTDPGFTALATSAWDAQTTGGATHRDIQVLWAGQFQTGRGSVLVGTDRNGSRRLAVLASGGPDGLYLLRDAPLPADLNLVSFNLYTDDEDRLNYKDTLVVVTPPASGWIVQWSGGPDPADGAGTLSTDDGIAMIDISQSGAHGHPAIRVLDGSTVVYEGPIGSVSYANIP